MYLFLGCGHCKQAKPEYERAAEVFKSKPNKVFATVDCTIDSGTFNNNNKSLPKEAVSITMFCMHASVFVSIPISPKPQSQINKSN